MQPDRRDVPTADFLPEAWKLLGEIETQAGRPPGDAEARATLAILLHRLRGSAALYDLPATSRLATALETRAAAVDGGRPALAAGAAWLRGALARVERAGAAGEPTLDPLFDRLPELALDEAEGGDATRRQLLGFAGRDREALADFLPEAEGYVESIAEALAAGVTGAAAGVDEVLRTVHTLKGTAYMVGCEPVGRLAHAMEDALQSPGAADGGGRAEPPRAALGEAAAALRRMLDVLAGGPAEGLDGELDRVFGLLLGQDAGASSSSSAAAAAVGESTQRVAPPAARRPVVRVDVERLDRVVTQVGELVVARGRLDGHLGELEATQELFDAVRLRMLATVRELERKFGEPSRDEEAGERPGPFSDAGLERYDDLDLLVRRVVEMEDDLGELQAEVERLTRLLRQDAGRTGELARGLRQGVTRARLVPMNRLLPRFERLASGLAREEGKEVRLEVGGHGVELDTAVAEQIAEPLLHLARNAVSHGLETPAERRAAGKPEAGSLALRVYPQGRFVHLEVEDDGRGIDLDALARRAVELGLLAAERAAGLDRREALDLIFLRGLSTRAEITAGAGRGVGMDAVRAAVARLQGEIEVETEAGTGTRVTLRVPLTQVVSEALSVAAGEQRFLLPTLTVRTLLQVAPEAAADGGSAAIRFEGAELPLVGLAQALGLPARPAAGPKTVVVVRVVERSFGLVVDEVLGLREVMIQGLGELLTPLDHLAGAAVTGGGEVVLMLNPLALAPGGRLASRPAVRPSAAVPAPPGTSVLLVDDSLSVRKVLARRLERLGLAVTTAVDGEEALERLREGRFDALVTDLEMPRMNGYQLIETVRRRPESRELPLIVITTRAGREHGDLAHRLGADHYLTKPVDHDLLARLVRELAAGRRAPAAEAG
jgi:chemosensory pili system protein ChpA (sensor histidine kinase/response regulator)